ncbi:hypothetical protein BDV97DRAFT_370240 [Delphinella strobiligena]|nr:hypothetical protein BDV97DRAFT_370240 [Delphinella strobiligena]
MAVIVAGMEERRLFSLITESSARDRICHNISSIKGLIPSLYTLFESLKYLEPCSYALRGLLPGKVKGTIRQELFACYRPTSTVVVQMQEMQYNQVSATTEAGRELAYWQLWLFAMRHFPDLTSTLPRKDKGRPKPLARPINVLAYQNIDAERHLPDSIDNVSFPTYLNDVNHSAAMIAKGLAGNLAGLASSSLPRLTGNAHVPVQQRVGRPFESSFEEDRDYLFLPYLACEARSDLYITTYFATTNLFSTFFGVDAENIAFAEATRHDDIEARHNNIEARNGAIDERQENIDASPITFNEHDTEFRSNAFQMPDERNTSAEHELIDDESLDAEFLRLSQGSGAQNHEIEEQVNAQSATSGPNASRLCLVLVHMTDNEPATLRQKSLVPADIFKTEEMVSQIVHRIDESQQDFDPYH